MRQGRVVAYRPVNLNTGRLADLALDRFSAHNRKASRSLSPRQRAAIREDFNAAFGVLQESIAAAAPVLFTDYVLWLSRVSSAPGRHPAGYLPAFLAALGDIVTAELPADLRNDAGEILAAGEHVMNEGTAAPPSLVAGSDPCSAAARSCLEALIAGDRERGLEIILRLLESGTPPGMVYERVIRPILEETGRLWQEGGISVAQEHDISGAIRSFISQVQERAAGAAERNGKAGKTVIIACIAGEFHDIGSLILAGLFRTAGWDVFSTGADTPAEDIAVAAGMRHADAVVVSVTMPQHLPVLHRLIRSLRGDAGTTAVRILVGGRPFSLDPLLWQKIGADGYAASAGEAVATADNLIAARKS